MRKLILLFMKTSIQQEVAFRYHFAAKIIDTLILLAGSFGSIVILFSENTINGWTFMKP